MALANPQVMFSIIFVDLSTANSCFVLNEGLTPPPFGFWIKITAMRMILSNAIPIVKRLFIIIKYLRVKYILFRARSNGYQIVCPSNDAFDRKLPKYGSKDMWQKQDDQKTTFFQ